MRVLVASVTRAEPAVLRAHLQTILWQQLPKSVSIDLLYITDPALSDDAAMVLAAAGVRTMRASPKPQGAEYAVDSETHRWTIPTFHWLAREKQRLLDLAVQERYDALWLIDSDLLCAPDTLHSLLATEKPVVSAVFWTRWTPDSPPLPQVWVTHPYGFQGRGIEQHEFLRKLASRELVRVGGLGACTLIRAEVFDRVSFWPLIDGLPTHGMWQGEDRHFCIRAERNHVELWADAWPDVWHCYRPEDVEQIEQRLFDLQPGQEFATPRVGDLVSLTFEPCEEPAIAGHVQHVRGRLGALPILPELEAVVKEMRVGDERFIRVNFPLWYPLEPYRGNSRTVRVRLLSAKPYAPFPTS